MGKGNNIFDKFEELDKKYYNDAVRRAGEVLKIKEEITHDIKGFLSESDKMEEELLCSSSTSLMLREKPYTHEELLKQLVTDEELVEIKAYLNRPLYERIKWTNGDYIAVFIATIMGIGIEGLNLVWRPASPVDKEGFINKWFDKKLHNHEKGCPIDFMVRRNDYKFDFQSHRVRSSGHDISRFYDGLKQVMEGKFHGVEWKHGKRIDIIREVTLFGNKYPTKDWLAAFTTLVVHLAADFCSAHSLPLPLSSKVYEDCSGEFGEFIHDAYNNGFNSRHLTLNTIEVFLTIFTIKIWLWMKYGFDNRKKPEIRLQEYEMRTAVMGTLAGVNLTECAVFRNSYLLNIPVLISTIDSTVQMLHRKMDRNSMIMKAQRNTDDILAAYQELLLDREIMTKEIRDSIF